MILAAVDPALETVDRWLERGAASGPALRVALEALAERTLRAWSARAPIEAVARVRTALETEGPYAALSRALAPQVEAGAPSNEGVAPVVARLTAVEALRARTQAHGAEAYEAVEHAFRRSIARLGARFVATRARAAIDETMGPMHSTVVAADLLALLETVDRPYLEALSFALETLHDWAAIARAAEATAEKSRPARRKPTRALSSSKRRA